MRSTTRSVSFSRLVAAAFSVVLLVAFASVAGFMLFQERLAIGQAAGQQGDNIAATLQHDIDHTIAVLDSALQDAAAGLPLILEQPLSTEVRQLILFGSAMRQSEYGAVLVLDELGVTLFDSRSSIPRQSDFATRDWFKTHRDNPNSELVIGLSPRSFSNLPIITFSRRLTRRDGSFGGVVVAALQMSVFKDMFDSLRLGPRDDVIFRTTDGRGIYRRNTGTAAFGADVTASELFRATKDARTALVETVSVEDGVDRLFAFRRLGNLPLAVIVGLSLNDIYAAWWSEAWVLGTSLGLLLLLAILLASRLRGELNRRERAELEVRENETKFRLLADNASDMISRVDSNGHRNYVSPAAVRLLGVPAESLLGKSLWDFIEPEDRPDLERFTQRLHDGSISQGSACFRIRRADCEQRWIEAAAQPVLDPVTGRPGGYISAWRDVTDRKCTEAQLSESESRYRLLADNATDIITCLDLDLCRTYVSPAAKVVLGYEPEEMMGVVPAAAIHPDDIPAATERFSRLRSGLTDQELLTNRIRHKNGHYVWVEAKLSLLRDAASGAPTAIMCAIRDISERKTHENNLLAANVAQERISRHLASARDAAEQASRAKSRFLANVSHELRTPLNGILGYTQLLQIEGGLSDRQSARVTSMLGAGQHLLEMINCVLDLSEVEAGNFELRPVPTSLGALTAACVDLIQPAADRKGLLLARELAPELPERLMVDPTRLRQILFNLLGNAVKFTQSGNVRLHARKISQAKLRVDVIDTGPGIAADQRDRLFHDFDRLGVEAAQNVEGAGIGLALAKRLAIAMGGSMGYRDNPAGGSVFWLELPLLLAERLDLPEPATDPVEEMASSSAAGLRVLVVDDIAVNRDVAASFLRAAGHHPICADGGEEAVAVVSATDLDLVLIDLRMPGMDGLEATRRIRALEGPRSRVAIIALTARAFADELSACKSAGMNGHLTKPFTQAALSAILQETAAVTADTRWAESEPSAFVPVATQSNCCNDAPIIDVATFQQTANFLPAMQIASHLQILIKRTELLITLLRDSKRISPSPTALGDLAETVHAVAGSAGILGFRRLLMVGRRFEHGARALPSELSFLTDDLIAAAEGSVLEMIDQRIKLEADEQRPTTTGMDLSRDRNISDPYTAPDKFGSPSIAATAGV